MTKNDLEMRKQWHQREVSVEKPTSREERALHALSITLIDCTVSIITALEEDVPGLSGSTPAPESTRQ